MVVCKNSFDAKRLVRTLGCTVDCPLCAPNPSNLVCSIKDNSSKSGVRFFGVGVLFCPPSALQKLDELGKSDTY